ncbi:MAG TPA: SDR family NAD(P)-dependent oxidoreductase [Streptomyces sp.]
MDQPSTHVDWSAGAVELLTEAREWPGSEDRPRRAGVSAFGISGTNAHLILEEAPPEEPGRPEAERETTAGPAGPVPWVLSGKSTEALREQAQRLLAHVRDDGAGARASVVDLAHSLAVSRTGFEHRAVVLGSSRQELMRSLETMAAGDRAPEVVSGRALKGRLAVLFTGQGAQRAQMGRQLASAFPDFARSLERTCDALEAASPELRPSLREVLSAPEGSEAAGLLNRTVYTQAALFAVEVALYRLVESFGIEPDFVAGHSVGEITAAHVAGVLSLRDAATLVAARGRLMDALPDGGVMVAVEATEEDVRHLLEDVPEADIAAVNGPRQVVLSGARAAVEPIVEALRDSGVRTRPLRVSHAFHSPLMEPMLTDFRRVAETLEYLPPKIALVSNVTGAIASSQQVCAPGYWVEHVRRAVRFGSGVRALLDAGVSAFLELGPDPVLTSMVRHSLPQDSDVVCAHTMRRGRDETRELLTGLSHMSTRGFPVTWEPVTAGARLADLPTYPFQQQLHWLHEVPDAADGAGERESAWLWDVVDRSDTAALADELGVDEGQAHGVLPGLAAWRERERARSRVSGWRYRAVWRPLDAPPADALPGRWLVVGPADDPVTGWCGRTLQHASARVVACAGPEDLARVLREHTGDEGFAGVLFTGDAELCAALVRRLGELEVTAPLWCVTRQAVRTGPADGAVTAEQAKVWGLGRVARLEEPHRWGGLVDLPEQLDDAAGRALVTVLAGCGEDEVAVRPAGPLARRIVPAPHSPAAGGRRTSGTVLVTGGTGALGQRVARWAAQRGARHLLLLSRSGPDAAGAAELEADLTRLGARVTVLACDVTDRQALKSALSAVPDDAPLTSVIHTAGVSSTTPLATCSPLEWTRVVRAKAESARLLDELTAPLGVRDFVLFSSTAGVWGGYGQSAYAAANAYLDALCEARRASGLPAVSIAWGPWADGTTADDDARQQAESCLRALDPDAAIRAMEDAVAADDGCVIVADVDWQRFEAQYSLQRPSPLLTELAVAPETGPATPVAEADGSDLAQLLRGMEREEGQRYLLARVRQEVAAVLGHPSDAGIDDERAFKELGFDSLTAVELGDRLDQLIALPLPATVVFDHPTPKALSGYLQTLLLADTEDTEDTADTADAAGRRAADAPGTEDPVAIVSMDCRFPGGVNSPDDFWRLLESGQDAVSEFPTDRGWDVDALYDPDPDQPGTTYTRRGAFIDEPDRFDAEFFGIGTREATSMDPQQRLLLETSWRAVERAGVDPLSLRESQTGVFVGTNGQDYLAFLDAVPEGLEGYLGTGNAASVLSGRIAYTLGLRGPALTVDTACSSALVALHLAARSLRQGECSLALVGAATVMSTPGVFVDFSRQRGLAEDGRCKAFSASADGTGWGEGVGVLVLERLSDARRNGHPVLAVLRGTAVNQDGASNGLSAPNGPAQQRVINQALADAGLTVAEVDAVEAHGTGTRLGDPIEAQALMATYGRDRPKERPLYVGSVKSNIGHTQAAAGLAGLMKMVLAMRHGVLPRTLHVTEPSPHVDWSGGAVALLTESVPWPDTGGPRRAGVSSFGISGTNVHAIIEHAPDTLPSGSGEDRTDPGPVPVPIPLSARGTTALRAQARSLRGHLDAHPGLGLADLGRSLATTRAALSHRAVVWAEDRTALDTGLAALAAGEPAPNLVTGRTTARGAVAYLFTGQGSQRPGMGRELYASFPAFAAAYDEVCHAMDPHLETPLRDVAFAAPGTGRAALLDRTEYAQPALFALEVAFFRLLEGWGLVPDLVAGHSVGELAAAHVAGVFDLTDAAALVAARGRLMQELPAGGAMVAVEADEDEVAAVVAGQADRLSIAAVNGPASTVLSGDEDTVLRVAALLAGRGRRTKRLNVGHAFHSPRMTPMLAAFRAQAERVTYHVPTIPLVSNLTGKVAEPAEITDADYWVRHVREPVRFADGVRTLEAQGARTFVELGPDGVLCALARECLTAPEASTVVPLLRADHPDTQTFTTALGSLYANGLPVDLGALSPEGRQVGLPVYPFQGRSYWLSARMPIASGAPVPDGPAEPDDDESRPDAAELRRRIAEAPPETRVEALTDLVAGQVAAVLGDTHRQPEPWETFSELGLNSLGTAELRARLGDVTGVRLPPAAIVDHPTAIALAAVLADGMRDAANATVRPKEPRPVDCAEPDASTAPLVTLFQDACRAGKAPQGLRLLATAADLRDTPLAAAEPAPRRSTFASGPARHPLVCFPSLVAPAHSYQYARFATAFRGHRDLTVLSPCGYTAGEPLPSTLAEFVGCQVAAIRSHYEDRPPVLVGYSSGGWAAQAVAEALAAEGATPAGVVLLDTYLPDSSELEALESVLFETLADTADVVELTTESGLSAMGRHFELFDGWRPGPAVSPTLLVRAAESFAGAASGASWPARHDVIDVPGDHLTLISEHGPGTGRAVASWLSGQEMELMP